MEQKAVTDACTAVALGWLAGKVVVELDAEKTIQIYVDHIEKKRKESGLSSFA